MSHPATESEQILDRIQNHKGVSGLIVVNPEGNYNHDFIINALNAVSNATSYPPLCDKMP